MKIQRTLPPAATPIYVKEILSGLKGIIKGQAEIGRFASELKEHFRVDHCFFVSSGKAALTIILRALHELHPERNEVVIPAYTCYSVPSAVLKAGLKVKLCDINPDTLDFDFDQLKELLSETSVLAVIPTHLFGIPANPDRIKEIQTDQNISLIEDAAQAMGGEFEGEKFGTLGDAGFFSLGRGKAFSTVEGGIILTNNTELAETIHRQIEEISDYSKLEILKLIAYSIILNIFMRPEFFWFPKSLPFLRLGETIFEPDFSLKRMSPFQAGLARNWCNRLRQLTKNRQQSAKLWGDYSFTLPLGAVKNIQNSNLALLRFPLKISNLNALNRILSLSEKSGLGIMRGYPDSINNITDIRDSFKSKKYPNARSIAQQIITLPVHHFLKRRDRMKIKKILNKELMNA